MLIIKDAMGDNKMIEIQKVEKIAGRAGQYQPGSEVPKLPAGERAEQLWGLFNEYSGYRRSLYRKSLRSRKGERSVSEMPQEEKDDVLTRLGQEPLVHRLEGEIGYLWQDPQVRGIFTAKVKESVREREEHAPSVKRYKQLRSQSGSLEEEYFDLLRNQFLMRQMTPTLRAIDIARNRAEQNAAREQIEAFERTGGAPPEIIEERHGLDREHADLAALLAYERIRDYHRQFKESGVIFAPSRLTLLEKVLQKTSSGTWMQLVGETGTGKTTFAKRASWILNGEPAQYVSGEKFGDTRGLIGRQAFEGDETYYQFGPLTTALTGCIDSREMEEVIRQGRETTGKLLILDELNKFDQDALFGALKVPATLQPGEIFNFKELPGVKLRMARKGVAIVATQNPATARYERKELDPALDRLFYDGKEKVDYPPSTAQAPELYEIFLGILIDDNGRIRVAKEELTPSFIEAEDTATGIVRQELDPDVKKHGALYRFALASAEVHKSFTQKESVAKTATDQGFLEKTALEMETLVKWIKGYSAEIEGGNSLNTYLEKKLNDFWSNIDSANDQSIYERIFRHFGFDIQNPRQISKPAYIPLTPIEMGYLSPQTPREVRRVGEEVIPKTRIYIDPITGEETSYLPVPMEDGSECVSESILVWEDGSKYIYLGKDENGNNVIKPLIEEEATND